MSGSGCSAPGAGCAGSEGPRGRWNVSVGDSQVLLVVSGALGEVVRLTEDLGNDFAEGVAEVPDPVGIDDGVDDRVGVREDDGHVHHPLGLGFGELLVEVSDAVQDVQGQPTEGKKSHDDGQRLGCVDLLLQCGPGVAHQLDLMQLFAGNNKYLNVDSQHDDERKQHAAKEVEVHHVAHSHHVLKEAGDEAAVVFFPGARPRLVGGVGTTAHGFIPAHKRRQPDCEGQEPQHSDEASRPLPRHQTVIPAASRREPR